MDSVVEPRRAVSPATNVWFAWSDRKQDVYVLRFRDREACQRWCDDINNQQHATQNWGSRDYRPIQVHPCVDRMTTRVSAKKATFRLPFPKSVNAHWKTRIVWPKGWYAEVEIELLTDDQQRLFAPHEPGGVMIDTQTHYKCPHCGRRYSITEGGKIPRHGFNYSTLKDCPGSGQPGRLAIDDRPLGIDDSNRELTEE